jgi:hypothetical protein
MSDELAKRGEASISTLTEVTGFPAGRVATALNQAVKRGNTGIRNVARGVYAYTKPNGVANV